jgi:WD40 repeat protein
MSHCASLCTTRRFEPSRISRIATSIAHVAMTISTNGAEVLTPKGHKGPVWSASFSPDGFRMVTASEDRTVRIWDSRAMGRE